MYIGNKTYIRKVKKGSNMKTNYTKEELIEIAVKQEEEIAKIRGYHSGVRAKHFLMFDEKTLIKCITKNAKTFNLKNPLDKVSA